MISEMIEVARCAEEGGVELLGFEMGADAYEFMLNNLSLSACNALAGLWARPAQALQRDLVVPIIAFDHDGLLDETWAQVVIRLRPEPSRAAIAAAPAATAELRAPSRSFAAEGGGK